MERPVVVITGGSRGIGAATVRLAAERGYGVAFNYLNAEEEGEQLCTELHHLEVPVLALRCDVTDEVQVQELFKQVVHEMGVPTALVNNAGILETQMPLSQMSKRRFERVLQVNVIGAFLCAREAVRLMSKSSGGSGGAIVNVSSMAARLGSPGEYIDYAASKGAIDSLTVGLATEVAHEGIRVNAVRPGIIHTDIHSDGGEPGRVERIGPTLPLGRGGRPEEVAEAIMWLLSDAASYSTGSFIDVAGGR